MTPLLLAARQGYIESAQALLDAGADVNQVSAGDKTSPLLIATHQRSFRSREAPARSRREPEPGRRQRRHAAVCRASTANGRRKSLYPQPRAHLNQKVGYLDLMTALLDKGADPNARLKKKVWYSGYSFDLSGVDEIGATPFWRAAYASDVDAMKLLVARGADPNIPVDERRGTPAHRGCRARRAGCGARRRRCRWAARACRRWSRPPASGYGEGFAANSHRFAPGGHARRGQVSRRRAARRRQRRRTTKATPRCTTPRRAATSR